MRLYPLTRIFALPILLAYVGVRLTSPEISILGDLVLFNLVALFAALSVFTSRIGHRSTRIPIALAIFSWSIGSLVSSWNGLVSNAIPPWLSDAGYVAFYPLLFLGLMSTLRNPREDNRLQLLDSIIIAVGLSSILSIFTLTITSSSLVISSYEVVLKNFYPIADTLLVATALVIILRSGLDRRNLLTLLALILFTLTDLLFLIQSVDGSYRFGSWIDSGWLVALILIAESQWHRQAEEIKVGHHPFLATVVAAFGSSIVIALKLLSPTTLPNAAIFPALITLLLAFVRMSLALTQAQRLNEVSILAKTDELTGLANRRKLIEELQVLSKGDCLFLIDLNNFKPINDNYGHAAGDELLRQVALRLSRTFDRNWVFARLGGDEFGLLIKGASDFDEHEIREVAGSIVASFSYPFHLSQIGDVTISASSGVAIEEGQGDLLRRADLAMYHAKRNDEAISFWSDLATETSTVSPLTYRR